MTEQIDRDAAAAFFRDKRTGLSVKFNLGHDPSPLLEILEAHRQAAYAAGMERAAEIAEDHRRDAWKIAEREGQNNLVASGRNHAGREIAAAIRAEKDKS